MQRFRIDIDPDCALTRPRSTRSGWKRNSISPTYFRASCFASETIKLKLSSNSATAERHYMDSIGPFPSRNGRFGSGGFESLQGRMTAPGGCF
jgi:hypothetical protein